MINLIEIDEIVRDFLKPRPRLVCICGKFEPVKRDEVMAWTQCKCGGWLSDLRAVQTSREVDARHE